MAGELKDCREVIEKLRAENTALRALLGAESLPSRTLPPATTLANSTSSTPANNSKITVDNGLHIH
eukprot:1319434-Amorphochlora_amoeboformis.AAC.1